QAPELIEAPAEAAHQDDVVERAPETEVVGDAAVQEVNVAARALEVAVDYLSVPKAARGPLAVVKGFIEPRRTLEAAFARPAAERDRGEQPRHGGGRRDRARDLEP